MNALGMDGWNGYAGGNGRILSIRTNFFFLTSYFVGVSK